MKLFRIRFPLSYVHKCDFVVILPGILSMMMMMMYCDAYFFGPPIYNYCIIMWLYMYIHISYIPYIHCPFSGSCSIKFVLSQT